MSKQKRMMPLYFFIGGGLLLLIAVFLLAGKNASGTSIPISSHVEETYPEILRVSLDEARAALDSNLAIFIDVRSAQAFQASHIVGAINIPLGELESRLDELDPSQWIITYCT